MDDTTVITQRIAIFLLLVTVSVTSACSATADPPAPTPSETSKPLTANKFPDMSGYTPANPDDYKYQTDNPGRPERLTNYGFITPDGVGCKFGQPPSGSCGGNNLPGIPPAACDPAKDIYKYNLISTGQGIQQWPRSNPTCADSSSAATKVLPPFHTLTVFGVTCGVDDKNTTACKDPQWRGFVLSPSWSGWLPHV